jgi:ankyrin repeat protein
MSLIALSTGLAPLHLAVVRNQIEMVKVLIRCGADINIQVSYREENK